MTSGTATIPAKAARICWSARAIDRKKGGLSLTKWLSIWIFTAPIVILGVPPQGLLLVAAFGLLAVKIAWDQIRFGDKKSWQRLGLVIVFMSLVFAVTPMFSMLFGAIRYVLENEPINQITYGIPWDVSWNAGGKSGFVFEAIRIS